MKKYGLLGYGINYSNSPLIHDYLNLKYDLCSSYELFDLQEMDLELDEFLRSIVESYEDLTRVENRIRGFNITTPYKKKVLQSMRNLEKKNTNIKVLSSDEVLAIESTNTCKVYQEDGILFFEFFNTDYLAFMNFIGRNEILSSLKSVGILGSSETSKMITWALDEINDGIKVTIYSREPNSIPGKYSYGADVVDYNQLKEFVPEVLINTTPLGQGEYRGISPVSREVVKSAKTMIDFNYNPWLTKFLLDGMLSGKNIYNGIEILIEQAILSSEIWNNIVFENKLSDLQEIKKEIYDAQMGDIIVYGMPLAGKSELYKKIMKNLENNGEPSTKYCIIDLDNEIEKMSNCSIARLIKEKGITQFRKREYDWLRRNLDKGQNLIIFAGGGTINEKNIELFGNARLYFLDVELEILKHRLSGKEMDKRPLLTSKEDLDKLYYARIEFFRKVSSKIFLDVDVLERELYESIDNKWSESRNVIL